MVNSDEPEIDPSDPEYDYVMYVDEGGDTGLKKIGEGGEKTSEWFVVGGIVIGKHFEADTPNWVSKVCSGLSNKHARELHFNRLHESDKRSAAAAVAGLRARAFVVASHKLNMRDHRNPRAERIPSQNPFYNFCLRVLLERASHTVAKDSLQRFGSVKRMKVILGKTGALEYSQTRAYFEYLRTQAVTGRTYLSAREVDPRVVDWMLIKPVSARNSAGVQLADVVTSSFYAALNRAASPPLWIAAAIQLRPIMATENGRIFGHGLTLLPWSHRIPADCRPIFEAYGKRW